VIEIGGGTGEDALWLADRGREVLMTDASASMVQMADAKFAGRRGLSARVAPAEALEELATEWEAAGEARFDGAYSNFAPLNCVDDLGAVARGLARLVRPGAPVLLMIFGVVCPGEMIVELLRGRPKNMFRRLARGDVHAQLRGQPFTVRYHRAGDLRRAMSPWFELAGRRGVGVFMPPSAAEPWVSRHPRLLNALESLDNGLSKPLAALGDHVLYRFVRTTEATVQ
jgi:SAM-dependent methyltransferase